MLIVIEWFRDCHVGFVFDRTTFDELFLPAPSFSGVGRLNVLYCGPDADEGIGLSVILLLRFVFEVVDTLNGRLFSDKPVAGFEIGEFVDGPAPVAGLDGTVTGVTVTDEFIILRGKVGDAVTEVDGVDCADGFDEPGCRAFGDVRRMFCCCKTEKRKRKLRYISIRNET